MKALSRSDWALVFLKTLAHAGDIICRVPDSLIEQIPTVGPELSFDRLRTGPAYRAMACV
jgi:hypothetical protein